MKRLLTRLVLSHLGVAVAGGAATFLLVRTLAPQMFDREMTGMGTGMGRGGLLRDQMSAAVNSALLVGVLVGVVGAALLGALAAYRLTRPLADLGAATRRLAAGRYAVTVPDPGTTELDALAEDIRVLATTLEQTEQRRVRLIGEVAHELRTPLTVVEGYVEGMIDGIVTADPDHLARIAAETRRLRRLADDLSSLSRAEEGRIELHCVAADLVALVGAAAERLRPQAVDAGVELRVGTGVGAGAPVLVRIDADRIAQVVTNLVGNALRATPGGGRVEVAVRADAGRAGAGRALVTVRDTGVGLAPEDLERVFERFYRVPARERGERDRAAERGSGIGLTIARRLVEAHGGTLTAASEGLGHGAVFTIALPLDTHTGRGIDSEESGGPTPALSHAKERWR
jgi:signal transduction histidine kinase